MLIAYVLVWLTLRMVIIYYISRMAIEAIRHGINLLIEKPLTMNTSEAELILEALKGSQVKVTLNYNAILMVHK